MLKTINNENIQTTTDVSVPEWTMAVVDIGADRLQTYRNTLCLDGLTAINFTNFDYDDIGTDAYQYCDWLVTALYRDDQFSVAHAITVAKQHAAEMPDGYTLCVAATQSTDIIHTLQQHYDLVIVTDPYMPRYAVETVLNIQDGIIPVKWTNVVTMLHNANVMRLHRVVCDDATHAIAEIEKIVSAHPSSIVTLHIDKNVNVNNLISSLLQCVSPDTICQYHQAKSNLISVDIIAM